MGDGIVNEAFEGTLLKIITALNTLDSEFFSVFDLPLSLHFLIIHTSELSVIVPNFKMRDVLPVYSRDIYCLLSLFL